VKTHQWSTLEATFTPERKARIAQQVEEEKAQLREKHGLALRGVREFAKLTQGELAGKAEMTQPELSRLERSLERGEDCRLSTLRRYVEALGGELELVAVVGGRRIPLCEATQVSPPLMARAR